MLERLIGEDIELELRRSGAGLRPCAPTPGSSSRC